MRKAKRELFEMALPNARISPNHSRYRKPSQQSPSGKISSAPRQLFVMLRGRKKNPANRCGEMPLLVQSGLGGLIALKSFLNASGVSTSQATPFLSRGLTVYPQVIPPTYPFNCLENVN
jgi:hypothetical protein